MRPGSASVGDTIRDFVEKNDIARFLLPEMGELFGLSSPDAGSIARILR